MTKASKETYSDPYLTKLRDSRKKSIGVEFMVNSENTYTMRKMAALKGFTEAQTQPRISELLTDGVIKVVAQRTDQIMKSKVSVYQFVKCGERKNQPNEAISLLFDIAALVKKHNGELLSKSADSDGFTRRIDTQYQFRFKNISRCINIDIIDLASKQH